MSGVEQVEASVGENDSPPGPALAIQRRPELLDRKDLAAVAVVLLSQRALRSSRRDQLRALAAHFDSGGQIRDRRRGSENSVRR